MNNHSWRGKALASIAALLVCFSYARADSLVYDNGVNDLNRKYGPGNNIEFGDEIFLEGGSTFTITGFKFETFVHYDNEPNLVHANDTGNESVNLRLRLNDGPVLASGRAAPFTQLFESGFINLSTGPQTHDFSGLAIALPPGVDHLTWTAEFVGIDTDEKVGLTVYHPPVVGSSYTDFWQEDGGTWDTIPFADGTPASFRAQVFARIPDGGSTVLLLTFALVLVAYTCEVTRPATTRARRG